MLDFLKNLFSTEIEDVLFAYRVGDQIGIVDGRGIKKYLKKDRAKEIYVFTTENINEKVSNYFNKIDNVKIIECNNFRKEIKKWKKKEQFKDKKIKKVSLDSFGERAVQRDPA